MNSKVRSVHFRSWFNYVNMKIFCPSSVQLVLYIAVVKEARNILENYNNVFWLKIDLQICLIHHFKKESYNSVFFY